MVSSTTLSTSTVKRCFPIHAKQTGVRKCKIPLRMWRCVHSRQSRGGCRRHCHRTPIASAEGGAKVVSKEELGWGVIPPVATADNPYTMVEVATFEKTVEHVSKMLGSGFLGRLGCWCWLCGYWLSGGCGGSKVIADRHRQ
jgi:hypothetical protein